MVMQTALQHFIGRQVRTDLVLKINLLFQRKFLYIGSTDSENLVPVLIGQGARIDIKDNFGRTPLHIHIQHGRSNAVGKS